MDLKKNQNMQKGFTLIELLITVVIMGILVSLAAPSFFGILEGRKLVGATDTLSATLRYAQTEAIKRNESMRVQFTASSIDDWCYGVNVGAACICTTANSCTIDGVEKVVRSTDFEGVTASEDGAGTIISYSVSFTPLRGFSSGETAFLGLSNGRKTKVVVSNLGRIRVCSPSGVGGYASC